MRAPRKRGSNRQRGTIQALPSGALRARVYSGVDPLSGKRVYLTETIGPNHPQQQKEAERALTRLLSRVDEKRAPRTRATVNKLMDRYLDLINVEKTTRSGYEGYIENHIRPLLGRIQVGKLDGETLDSFYAVLRRCRKHCDGRKFTEHAKEGPHECSAKYKPHTCKPLAASSIRQIHGCLSGALSRAQKWNWIAVNPLERAETPKAPKADPHPPTAAEAASIINAAFLDLD
ncbi:hypothetical protein L6E12_16465 [Actinokineospora sp. PR83]|uniref:hypothetical protein n=1 Tax=Actinokineospora sp. PR83 TaxID=2884908 RepID=UPI001F21A67D|nr:hypothetical protein [Actinokineospora sp. PR83]MCG8917380.1 hypothetical protein [Actinokineospora sp. PR83]